MARTVIYRKGGAEEVIPSKLVTTLYAGDRVVFETAGGGGYGDPSRRTAEQLRTDLDRIVLPHVRRRGFTPVVQHWGSTDVLHRYNVLITCLDDELHARHAWQN